MNGKDEIIKKRLYFEGLKQAIETPLAGEAMNDVEEVIQDDETEENIKETLSLWKEVNGLQHRSRSETLIRKLFSL